MTGVESACDPEFPDIDRYYTVSDVNAYLFDREKSGEFRDPEKTTEGDVYKSFADTNSRAGHNRKSERTYERFKTQLKPRKIRRDFRKCGQNTIVRAIAEIISKTASGNTERRSGKFFGRFRANSARFE